MRISMYFFQVTKKSDLLAQKNKGRFDISSPNITLYTLKQIYFEAFCYYKAAKILLLNVMELCDANRPLFAKTCRFVDQIGRFCKLYL